MAGKRVLILLAGIYQAVMAADPTFTLDTSFSLAINVAGVPAGVGCTISWARSDGIGPRVSQEFPADVSIRLLRFTPKKEYRLKIEDTTGKSIGSKEHYTCTTGETGVAEFDVDAPFVRFTGSPTFEMLVLDHAASLVGFNADGWIVWYLANGSGAWDQMPEAFNSDSLTHHHFRSFQVLYETHCFGSSIHTTHCCIKTNSDTDSLMPR